MIHLRIKEIKGDGQTAGAKANYKECIDCSSFSWGAMNSADANTPEGLTRSTSQISQISLTANVGMQSVNLMHAAATSRHFPEAKVHFTRTAGDKKSVEWMTLEMKNCVISNYNINGSEHDMGSESITIAFEEFKMNYFLIDTKGEVTNGPEMKYNITKREVL